MKQRLQAGLQGGAGGLAGCDVLDGGVLVSFTFSELGPALVHLGSHLLLLILGCKHLVSAVS